MLSRALMRPFAAVSRPFAVERLLSSAAPKAGLSEGTNISVEVTSAPLKAKHPEVDEQGRIYATGRRKTSVARVWVKEGNGHFIVNDEPLASFFQPLQRIHVLEPFIVSETAGLYDVWCTVKGGGISGQAGAVRLGVSRALQKFNVELRTPLKKAGLLTRDARRVERKKPGQHKARRQY
eukprot:gene45208-55299_t